MRLLLALWIPLLASGVVSPPDAHANEWDTARALYDAGRYEESLQAFQALSGKGVSDADSAAWHYNVGTLYQRLGKSGPALAYLEKANRLEPHDGEIRSNLQIVRKALGERFGEETLDPASSSLERLADRIDLDEVRGTLGLLGIILGLIWLRTYLKSRNLRETLLKPASLFVLAGFLISASLYGLQRTSDLRPSAVLLERSAVRSGPGERFVQLGQLESGVKIRLLGPAVAETPDANPSPSASAAPGPDPGLPSPEIWRQVRYSSEGIGWLKASSLLLLSPG